MRSIEPAPKPQTAAEASSPSSPPSTHASRRDAIGRLGGLAAMGALPALFSACGGGGDPVAPVAVAPPPPAAPPPPPPPPPPPAGTALSRLKAALAQSPPAPATSTLSVTQGLANTVLSTLGSGAVFLPPMINPTRQTLGTVPQVWGFRRDLWTAQPGAVIGDVVFPMSRDHVAASSGSNGVCGMHFVFDGRAFEILFAGSGARVTLVVDGRYAATRAVETVLDAGVAGARLSVPNTLVRFDLGSAASRRISLYAVSSQGPCAIVVAAGDRVEAWDRSSEPSMTAMTESYGMATSTQWGVSGPFWEAAALLGIPHLDRDAIGGTGYAPNNATALTRLGGNAFPARLPSNVDAAPDLFITAGGINDNNSVAAPPLYATAADARAAFDAAVSGYFASLRAALPSSVLVALGPWAPRQSTPPDPVARSKADAIQAALQSAGAPWVFLDNLVGSWANSAGATSAVATGPWQTGTGHVGAPAGDGNGDLYLGDDGVHPNEAGCSYLAGRIAADLRAAIAAL